MQLNKLALALVFCLGYITSDILNEINFSLISPVKVDVAGMDYYDLRTDYDFKKAVKYLIEDMVEGCNISGYADREGYIYSSSISC